MIVPSGKSLPWRVGWLGVVVLAAAGALVKTWLSDAWEENLKELLLCFAGLVAFLFPDEFASFEGYRAWRMSQWRFPPAWSLKVCGFVLVLLSAGIILLRG